jgi:hypothetical protein
MLILLLALAALPTSSPAKSSLPAKKGQLLEQLHKICVKNSFQEGKSQDAACDCLKANYEKKLGEEDLELLARIQNGSVGKAELEGKDELLEFDMEASQHCVEDAAWRWVPVAKPKEESEEAKAEKPKKAPAPKPAPKKKKN